MKVLQKYNNNLIHDLTPLRNDVNNSKACVFILFKLCNFAPESILRLIPDGFIDTHLISNDRV